MVALVTLQVRESIPLLIRIAQDEIGLRGMAVQALIDLRAEEAAPALLPLLNRLLGSAHEEKLCCSLIFLMTAVDYRFAMPDVRAFLDHRLAGVRCAALKAVARWRDEEAVEIVRQMAHEDGSAFVRPVALTALIDLIGANALADLCALADDANSLVRAGVAESLAGLPELAPGGIELLVRLSADSAAPVARAARESLAHRPDRVPSTCAEGRTPTSPPLVCAEHAAAVRAFLSRWQGELPEQRKDLAGALETLLRALAG